jgi:hypothetical protein
MPTPRPSPRPHGQRLRRSAWVAGGLLLVGALVTAPLVCSRAPERARGPSAGNPPQVQSEFLHHAGALALGGTVRRLIDAPPREALVGQGAVVLPPSGGKGVAEIKDFRYGDPRDPKKKDSIVVASARSEVLGVRKDGDCYETTSHSILSGLDVRSRLHADEIEVRLMTRHCLGRGEDTTFRSLITRIEGLTIDKVPIEVRSVAAFTQDQTLGSLIARHKTPGSRLMGFDGKPMAFDSELPPRRSDKAGHPVFEDRLVMTSVFEKVGEKELPVLERGNKDPKLHFRLLPGNGIYIPDFGKVYFGRALISRTKREIAALHLELGSPMDAGLDVCDIYGNGTEFP